MFFARRYPEFPRETIHRPIYLALWDLNNQPLPGLHSFSSADVTGIVA